MGGLTISRSQHPFRTAYLCVFTPSYRSRTIASEGAFTPDANDAAMITYNIYIVIRETGQFSSKGIINDFIGNLDRLTVSRRFTEQAA